MSQAEEKLTAIAAQLKKGVAPQRETVRALLLWFSAGRRGYRVVRRIRGALKRHGVVTHPDFEWAYIDGLMTFAKAPPDGGTSDSAEGALVVDPTYRLGRLTSANKPPVSVKPDAGLQEAVTLMMSNDFSQLPVMTGPRDVKGIVSWKTIGHRLALKRPCQHVRDCMGEAFVVSIEESLFSALSVIAAHDYVLVQANNKKGLLQIKWV